MTKQTLDALLSALVLDLESAQSAYDREDWMQFAAAADQIKAVAHVAAEGGRAMAAVTEDLKGRVTP